MDSPSSPPATLWSKNLVFAIFATFCVGVTNQLLSPTMPIYLVEIGIDKSLAGIMTTFFAMGSLVFRPFAGQLVDYIGRKKMFLVGATGCILVSVAYNLTKVFGVLLALRVVHGLSLCLCSTAVGTMVVDLIPRERITEGIGYYGLAGAFSQTIGPAVGLLIQERSGIGAVFFMTLGLSATGFLFGGSIKYKEQRKQHAAGEKIKIKIYENTALYPSAMMFVVSFCQCTLSTFLALYGISIGVGSLGNFFLLTSVGIVFSRFFAGRLIARVGEGKVLVASCFISSICFVVVAFARAEWMFIVAALVYGFGYGILYPLNNGMSMRNAIPENRGAATATFMASFDLGTVIGTSIWGFVIAGVTYTGMYLAAAVLMWILPVIYFKLFIVKYPD